ncbi:MAG: sigma-E processing peptidase SpoIIGA [Oscillospiraceae bacterium]
MCCLTVYLDVLLVLNIYVNYFLLKATSKFCHTPLRNGRCVISSIIGSVFSLIIMLPPMPFLLLLLIKLFAAIVVVSFAFGIKNKQKLFKLILLFYAINFVFAGVMLGIIVLTKSTSMQQNNTFFYIDFSILMLVISTIIAYFIITIVRRILDRKAVFKEKYSIIISYSKKMIVLTGIADTGNVLTDVFSGKSVIICNIDKFDLPIEYKKMLECKDISKFQEIITAEKHLKGMKILPFSTLNSNGIIPVFVPDSIHIKSLSDDKVQNVSALIGIAEIGNSDYDAIFNPNIFL